MASLLRSSCCRINLFQTEDNDCSVPVAQPLFEKKDSSVPVSKTKRIWEFKKRPIQEKDLNQNTQVVPLSERMTINVGKNEEGIPFSTLEIKDTDKTDRRVREFRNLRNIAINIISSSARCSSAKPQWLIVVSSPRTAKNQSTATKPRQSWGSRILLLQSGHFVALSSRSSFSIPSSIFSHNHFCLVGLFLISSCANICWQIFFRSFFSV